MIAEAIKREIRMRLLSCDSPRQVRRVFEGAQKNFDIREVPLPRRMQVLREIRMNLPKWINDAENPSRAQLILEAERSVDAMLRGNSWEFQ